MTTTLNKTTHSLSLAKAILFTLACIFIFIFIAIVCGLFTFWIPFNVLKIVIRELFLRMPLTIFALHLFAGKVIKAYNPTVIYGKLTLLNTLKWTIISFILPVLVWLFYYVFHFAGLFKHTISLSTADLSGILVKWTAISIAAGLTEEVLFRGHLFMIISSSCSKFKAILISSLIFGLVHIFMLSSFSLVDIMIVVAGGFIAGIMFSCIYQYTKVIWYAAIVHGIWDVFFIGKITNLAASQADANHTIIAFKLTTKSMLLTGGNFGLEAGLPCLIVYLLVIGCFIFAGRLYSKEFKTN